METEQPTPPSSTTTPPIPGTEAPVEAAPQSIEPVTETIPTNNTTNDAQTTAVGTASSDIQASMADELASSPIIEVPEQPVATEPAVIETPVANPVTNLDTIDKPAPADEATATEPAATVETSVINPTGETTQPTATPSVSTSPDTTPQKPGFFARLFGRK